METTDSSASHSSEHRARLLEAMAEVATAKGLAAATIADIVREAGVSKRTFYEHFTCKEGCFLALYRAASASALKTLREAVQPDRPWQAQVEHALSAYLAHLEQGTGLIRTLFVEIHHLGVAGLAVRREVMQELADFLCHIVSQRSPPANEDHVHTLTTAMALAAVGGINELILAAVERGETEHLTDLTACASDVVRSLTRADVNVHCDAVM
jgi:AcrR family transcriptional regulator